MPCCALAAQRKDARMNIDLLISRAAGVGASDLHLICGLPPQYRIEGALQPDPKLLPLTAQDCEDLAQQLAGLRFGRLENKGELDGSATIAGSRIRMNIFRQQEHFSMAIRLLADKIPDLAGLGLPPAVMDLTNLNRGIVLVTGETGSGKSTTLAAMIDHINHQRACHVLTLEDPIEYQYTPDRCIFNQREIGRDTENFAGGLRAALREDPDIILVGELRDRETIETALTAAETGHLVFGTLHTASAADTIDCVVGVFPPDDQQQIRMQLSMTLRAVLSQQLLLGIAQSRRMAACELMIVTNAIRNLIREGKTPQISSTISTSAADGSVTMDASILRLYRAGRISASTAVDAARDRDYMRRNISTGIPL